ncbi:MAG: hypothetical protein IPJ41_02650 [Phycisphaerales bacterium]|nr:hypothetical protein [Phycisphaerales bacterium]
MRRRPALVGGANAPGVVVAAADSGPSLLGWASAADQGLAVAMVGDLAYLG